MKLLLDEMYPAGLAEALRSEGIDASTASQLGLAGLSDLDLFTAAVAKGDTILSENIADFSRISPDHISAGCHHSVILFALSSRFTRRPGGSNKLLSAICSVGNECLDDRIIYLSNADPV